MLGKGRKQSKKGMLIKGKRHRNEPTSKPGEKKKAELPEEDPAFDDEPQGGDDEDSFDSEMADGAGQPEIEEETTDEKRRRIAKSIIDEARLLRKRQEYDEDEEEEDKAVTGYLQDKLLSKRRMKFEHYLSRLDQKDIVKGFDRVEIKGHMRQITCCRFVPLKPMLISAAKDGSILYCRASLYQVDISDSKNTVRKVLSHGMPKDPNGHSDEILCMDISFDGKFLITGGRDCFIKIWNLTTMSFVGNLEGHKNSVNVEE